MCVPAWAKQGEKDKMKIYGSWSGIRFHARWSGWLVVSTSKKHKRRTQVDWIMKFSARYGLVSNSMPQVFASDHDGRVTEKFTKICHKELEQSAHFHFVSLFRNTEGHIICTWHWPKSCKNYTEGAGQTNDQTHTEQISCPAIVKEWVSARRTPTLVANLDLHSNIFVRLGKISWSDVMIRVLRYSQMMSSYMACWRTKHWP